MPTPRTWLPRTNEILTILREMTEDELDRQSIEKLFQIQKRMALHVIHDVGPLLSGCSFKVDRKELIAWVEKIYENEGAEIERRRRVADELEQETAQYKAARRALADAGRPPEEFPVVREMLSSSITSLPPGVQLTAGQIVINFDPANPQEALQLLYQLGIALANDYEAFLGVQVPVCSSVRPSVQPLD